MRLFFLLAFAKGVPSNERPKRVTAKRKNSRQVITIFSLVGAVLLHFCLAAAPMFTTPIMGFARPRRNIILTTQLIIIRTILGMVTTAARTTTASESRVNPPPRSRQPK